VRGERRLDRLDDLGEGVLVEALLALVVRGEPHVGDLVRGEVARQDDDRVLEVDEAPLAVGEHALVEHLVEQVHHVGIGLLALVEEHHGVRPLAHRLGEHAALAVADVAGR
jgi:hypothetical protein